MGCERGLVQVLAPFFFADHDRGRKSDCGGVARSPCLRRFPAPAASGESTGKRGCRNRQIPDFNGPHWLL
jgi:hypothetical protein